MSEPTVTQQPPQTTEEFIKSVIEREYGWLRHEESTLLQKLHGYFYILEGHLTTWTRIAAWGAAAHALWTFAKHLI